uniref:BPTI/Kunitz inhibitor domain-containing protein n=1 Tax=Cyanistes caeruleus TaxID=156563 RepID=A0A8C0VJ12_CYACU
LDPRKGFFLFNCTMPHYYLCPFTVCPTAEPCRLPLDEGDCQRYTLRWYYNQRVTECRPFVYSGCQGNLNRFDSKEECELHCGNTVENGIFQGRCGRKKAPQLAQP